MGRSSDAGERLVRTAARLFLTRSFQHVGVEEICAEANVRKGSFYYYFKSKTELAKAVIDLHASVLWASLDAVAEGTPTRRLLAMASAIEAIQQGFEERHGRIVGCPFGNLAAELSTTDPYLGEELAAVFGELERRFAVVCHEVAADGALRPGVDPDRLAALLNAQFQGLILLAKVRGSSAAGVGAALHELIARHVDGGEAEYRPPATTGLRAAGPRG